MPCNYDSIREDNKLRYGTDIARIGPMLLADRYDDRSHFIYELLQNAEDALARRGEQKVSRVVSFDVDSERLRVSHYGVPFDEDDVVGVCGIGESTKNLTAIGRFGIGFKSVYAFSDRPEVHSGDEDFAIESYVWPVATEPVDRDDQETVFIIPLKRDDYGEGKAEIAEGLSRLGASSLLFLREIEEIRWSVDGVHKGVYLRQAVDRGPGVRFVTVIGEKDGEPEVDEEWLVCSREVHDDGRRPMGRVELAWSVAQDEDGRVAIRRVERSRLVVFFPTAVETGLGFLVQGPYRTTPSRDNVPSRDDWNRGCVSETGTLLAESLRWLREQGFLDANALACLPLDSSRFEDSMFRTLFDVTKRALIREDLLPAHGGGYVSGGEGRLARTQELRALLEPRQLAKLEGGTKPLRWVSGQISQDRTPALRRYLIDVLGMKELTPDTLVSRLSEEFLESQDDDWTQGSYEFFGSHAALRPRLLSIPVIRLADGSHVAPFVNDEIQAFLPSSIDTDFPTVRESVCRSEGALEFLKSLNLTEPDPVDDVIRNVLPKYREVGTQIPEADYTADIGRMLEAAATDSQSQRDRLVEALRETPWVSVVDVGDGRRLRAMPRQVYVATERLRELFADIRGVLLVDSEIPCLRGEPVRELLERSGAARYLQPVWVRCDLSWAELRKVRRREGLERSTSNTTPKDFAIRGLRGLIDKLPTLEPAERSRRAASLWDALCDLHDRRGSSAFEATYEWSYSHESRRAKFDPAFVRLLDKCKWVPDSSGTLREPASITLDTTGWPPNGFLESKIQFKPPLVEQLAKEVGIEPGVLDLLRRLGVTSEAELRQRLDLEDDSPAGAIGTEQVESGEETIGKEEDGEGPEPSSEKHLGGSSGDGGGGTTEGTESTEGSGKGSPIGTNVGGFNETEDEGNDGDDEGRSIGMRFVSYVGVVGEGAEEDPDGLEHVRRMELEAEAIELILSHEPDWGRTPPNNAGFDLYRGAGMELATEWCEVKAMTGTLRDRPVGLSRTQFEWARQRGDAYWLYVVERAGTSDAEIVRIQDPAGKAMTFTFDHGWRAVAAAAQPAEEESA